MITLTLQRNRPTGKAVTGTLILPFEEGQRSAPTLENAEYIIPAGTYPLERTWSPKFKKQLPLVCEVPDREGIRIHKGTIPEHSQGCILTDIAGMAYLDVLFNQIELFNEDEKVQIEILDPA